MFTGIIEDRLAVKGSETTADGLKITFERPASWQDLELGESISTDGVCLTVASIQNDTYDCLLVPETLAKTTFGKTLPELVNVERAMRPTDRLGGHFVQGHVDGLGQVEKIIKDAEYRVAIRFAVAVDHPIINKGSIAINGVSLTVADLNKDIFEVALVPYTLQNTTLGNLKRGDPVNLEFDMIGKYVAKLVEPTVNA